MSNYTLLVLFFSVLLSGCASLVKPSLSSSIRYQKDLKVEVQAYTNKAEGYGPIHTVNGMGVVPYGTWYKVRVYPPETADMISLTTCHREVKKFKPRKSKWKKYYEFTIEVVPGIEINKVCGGFQIGLFHEGGQHAWSNIVVESKARKLPALVKCNGKVTQYQGTSTCQSKQGLIQSIEFDRKVRTTKVVGCTIKASPDGKVWEYMINPDEWTIVFMDSLDERISHKHVMYGYQVIAIRGFK